MIDFYTAKTPNGYKVHILLEELGMKYRLHWLDLSKNEQKHPEYLKINPNGRIPAIVDQEGALGHPVPVFESGAILIYLAEKSSHFLGSDDTEKARVMSWLMFQMSGIGPNFGNYYYAHQNDVPAMLTRFELESLRLIGVLDGQLNKTAYLAGDFYSIADIATYPWIESFLKFRPDWFKDQTGIQRWARLIAEREAVRKVFQS